MAGHVVLFLGARWLAVLAVVVSLAGTSGCTRDASPGNTKTAPESVRQTESIGKDGVWEAFYLRGSKIGYSHTTTRDVDRDGRRLVETRAQSHLVITRFQQKTEQELQTESLETPAGELLEFRTKVEFGPTPTVVSGRVQNDRMAITTKTQGRQETTHIAWSPDVRGFRAIEQSLARSPMQPGQRRSLKMLLPLLNQIAQTELTAVDYEVTALLGLEAKLLRVEAVARLPGNQSIQSTLWTDERGEVLKTRLAALQQETFRTTRNVALAPAGTDKPLDLGLDLIVKVDPPLARPDESRRVRYGVELTTGDPTEAFKDGGTQSVKSVGPHAAEVTVRSLRPGNVGPAETKLADVDPQYTSATSVLQIDDPRIQEMAREARAEAADPAAVALALERYVNRAVSEKNFSQSFATAAEVADSREGDCTEHAVLLAALARACGIPSRVAIGLVYLPSAGGFGYHMWTEVLLHGQWVPLDAIMGQGGTSAAYLKLADSSLDGASAYSSFLAVAGVLGQLKVRVIDAE